MAVLAVAGVVSACASASIQGKDDDRIEVAADAIDAASCRLVSRLSGSDRQVFGTEDLAVSRDLGLVFVSSTHRKEQRACKAAGVGPDACVQADESDVGGLFVYVPGEDVLRPVVIDRPARRPAQPLVPGPAAGLMKIYPHGIDLFEEDGKRSLFMISHPWAQDGFYESETVNRTYSDVHLYSINVDGEVGPGKDFTVTLREEGVRYDPAWDRPEQRGRDFNDIAALDLNRFLVTDNRNPGKLPDRMYNRLRSVIGEGGPARVMEGAVGSVNGPGGAFRTIIDDLSFANGIAVKDGQVYVADSLSGAITEYPLPEPMAPPKPPLEVVAFDAEPERPEGRVIARLSTVLDNLSWSADGERLLVAGHTFFPQFLVATVVDDPMRPSASQAFSIIPGETGKAETIAEVFKDDGGLFSASSVMVEAGGERILGGVYGPGILACL